MIAAASIRRALPHSAQSSAPRSPCGQAQKTKPHVGVRPLHSDVPAISPGVAPAAGGVRAGRPSLSQTVATVGFSRTAARAADPLLPGCPSNSNTLPRPREAEPGSAGRSVFSSRPAAPSNPEMTAPSAHIKPRRIAVRSKPARIGQTDSAVSHHHHD